MKFRSKLLLCLFSLLLSAQQPGSDLQKSVELDKLMKFRNYDAEQGLGGSSVVSIHQDSYGFMWIGTTGGLNLFDGYSFKIYKHNPDDTTSISDNRITCIFEDPIDKGRVLWVGTENGLNRFDRESDSFISFVNDPDDSLSLNGNSIGSILKSRDGTHWIGCTTRGLAQMIVDEEKGGGFQDQVYFIRYVYADNDTTLSNNFVRTIFEDRSGRLWVPTSYGLSVMDKNRKKFTRYFPQENDPSSISSYSVKNAVEDSNGKIWVGTLRGSGLQRAIVRDDGNISFKRHQVMPGVRDSLQSNMIFNIHVDKADQLWLATADAGVVKYDGKRFIHWRANEEDPNSLRGNTLLTVTEDRSGMLWVGSFFNGAFVTDELYPRNRRFKQLTQHNSNLIDERIHSICEDASGQVWVGTESGIFSFRYQEGRFTLTNEYVQGDGYDLHGIPITALLHSSRGYLWFSSPFRPGLNRLDPTIGKVESFYHQQGDSASLLSNTITGLYEDNQERLWIATASGIARYTEFGFINYIYDATVSNTLASSHANVILHDRDSLYWVGTSDGLSKLILEADGGATFTNYYRQAEDSTALRHSAVRGLLKDSSGRIWIGTDGGLHKLIEEKNGNHSFRSLGKEAEESTGGIFSIMEDDLGRLWLHASRGLVRFDARTHEMRRFDSGDGLPASGLSIYARLRHSSGTMIHGSLSGLYFFDPESITDRQFITPVVLTSLQLLNKPVIPGKNSAIRKHISFAEEIHLDYDDNFFALEFAALDYYAPAKNRYAYKLEGLQEEWVYSGDRRRAEYTDVDPGKYLFRVKATNNDGIWNDEGASIRISIAPPPWKTWWAYTIYLILGLAAFLGIRRYELNRQNLRHELELEHIQAEKMQELDRLKSRFFANISHEFRTPLTLILSPLQQFIAGSYSGDPEKQYPVMIRHARRLLRLVNQLLDLSKLEAGRMTLQAAPQDVIGFLKALVFSFSSIAEEKSIRTNFHTEEETIELYYEREKLEHVMVNLMSNAMKFTPDGGEVTIGVAVRTADDIPPGPSKGGNRGDADPAKDKSMLTITVSDTGIGIAEERLPYIFDRFYQVDDSLTREQEGTGIGLALSKELIELHGGSIAVESEGNGGTTFIVQLPLGRDHLAEEQIIEPDHWAIGNDQETSPAIPLRKGTDGGVPEGQSMAQRIPPDGSEQSEATNQPIILVVEDNKDVRTYIQQDLQSKYRIELAENGEEGLAKALELIPDLIISDVMMPKMDGFQLCEKLKTDELTSHVPVILLTARASAESKLEGLETGADDYLTKPFDIRELQVRVKNLIEQRQRLRARFGREIKLEPKDIAVTSVDEQFLKRAMEIVEAYMSDTTFDVDTFSREVGVSRSRLHRKLKALTDQSTTEFIRTLRLKRAAQILQGQGGSVTEIAYDVGFNNLSYFIRSFHTQFGESPSNYAARFRD